MASKKTNPIGIRLSKTKNWNLNNYKHSDIIPKDILLRQYIIYKLETYKIKLLSYKIQNLKNKYYIYINILPIKQKLFKKKNYLKYFKNYMFHNLFYKVVLKLELERSFFQEYKINSLIYFKNNIKSILKYFNMYLKNSKERKKKKKFNKALTLYYFEVALIYNSTIFLSYFIKKMLKKYKKQKTVIWKLVISTIKEAFKYNNNILGIRLKIKGKINGKKRSQSLLWALGSVTSQTNDASIKYCYTYCYNIFGSFGIKLWLNLK